MKKLNFDAMGRGTIVVLSHALGSDLRMWDEVAGQLAPGFTVVRYDHPGHGRSAAMPGPWSIEGMADEAASLIEDVAPGPVHFVGLSMGGMVAQQLAVRHPHLVSSIVVANSSSYYGDVARGMWRARIETVRNLGLQAIAGSVMQRWFTPAFRDDAAGAQRVAELRRIFEGTDARVYAACCEAISRIDFYDTNPRIACPTLVVAGSQDESTPPSMAATIRNSISGAQFAQLEAAHLSAVERPVEFSNLVADFIRGL